MKEEWNFEDALTANYELGMEEGMEKGMEKGKAEGKAEGIIDTSLEDGLSENEIITRLQNKLKVSLGTAQEYFKMFGKQTV